MPDSTNNFLREIRRPRVLIPIAALVVVFVLAGILGGGSGVDPDAVARVGDEKIEKSEFDHWLETAARSQQTTLSPAGGGATAVPDPPDYRECISSKQQQAEALQQAETEERGDAPPPETPSTEDLRLQCEEEYELLKEQVMQFLVQAEAVQQEAEERGVELSDEEVRARFDDLKQESFPDDQQYQQFLEQSGMSEEDLLYRVRLDLLINEIRESVLAEEGEVSEEEIAAYYEENRDQPPVGQPEERKLRAVVTESEEQAQEARERIEDGDSWEEVARDLSIDPASKEQGGQLTLQEGAEEEALNDAVFTAEKGELEGPVETELGWYVFEVEEIQPAEERTLEESREAIADLLRTQREQEILTRFQNEFTDRVRDKTVCAEEFVIVGCKNGPEAEEAPPPGVPVPPEGAPPPAPEGGPPAPPQGGTPPVPPEGGGPQEAP
jgi:foldase protein PrsA